MPFFTGSSDVRIDNSYLSEIAGDFIVNLTTTTDAIPTILGKRKERDGSELDAAGFMVKNKLRCRTDGLVIVKRDKVDLRGELVSGPRGGTYRIHSACYGGRTVAVKVFEGPHASKDYTATIALFKKLFHSNVPKIIGVSDKSSANPFVVFRGVSEKRIQPLIAKALRTDLNKSVELSMKAVKGLAAGLSYIVSQKIPLPGVWVWNLKNFDILAGDNDEPVIAIHPSSNFSSQDFDSKQQGIDVLNGLCQRLFSEANSILYDDSPDRRINNYGLLATTVSHSEGISDSEAETTTPCPVEQPKSSQPPRREVCWVNLGANSQSLDSIAHHFQDYIDCFLSSGSSSTLRRIRAITARVSHTCPGYLREEITLTSEVSKSAIVSHAFADEGERCSFCGDLVVGEFERDFGQWFSPEETEELLRFLDQQDLERESGPWPWINPDDVEGLWQRLREQENSNVSNFDLSRQVSKRQRTYSSRLNE